MIPGEENVKGIPVKNWKCSCGNKHVSTQDVDEVVRFYRFLNSNNEVEIIKSDKGLVLEFPEHIVKTYNLTHGTRILIRPEEDRLVLKILKS